MKNHSMSVEGTFIRIGLMFGTQVAFSIVEKQMGMKTMYSRHCEALLKGEENSGESLFWHALYVLLGYGFKF